MTGDHHDDDHPDDELQVTLNSHGGHPGKPNKAVVRRLTSIGLAIPQPKLAFPSCRNILMLMSFLGFINIYCLRVNLSVALVEMVQDVEKNDTDDEHAEVTSTASIKEKPCPGGSHAKKLTGDFVWTADEQGFILGAFFYGYITTQLLGGVLSHKYGGKRPLLFGVGWTALLTCLTPIITRKGGFYGILFTRILEGVGEGVTYPAMHALLSRWAPPLERSQMVTSVYAGSQIGTVIAMPVSALLCEISWDWVFYVFGALGLLWAVFWTFLVYDSPAQHPRIDPAERDYIEQSQGLIGSSHHAQNIPWKSIAKSLPVYAAIVAHFCNNWGYYMLLTTLPQYLKYILKFDIKGNGLVAGLPYLVMWMFTVLGGLSADYLRSHKIVSTTVVRKLYNGFGFMLPAVCLVMIGFMECNIYGAVTFIVLGVGLSGISLAGWSVNHLDLAPAHAGSLMGITNMLATIPGFVSPSIVGFFTREHQTRHAWKNVFWVSFGVYCFGTVFYVLFGSGSKQGWATSAEQREEGKRSDQSD